MSQFSAVQSFFIFSEIVRTIKIFTVFAPSLVVKERQRYRWFPTFWGLLFRKYWSGLLYLARNEAEMIFLLSRLKIKDTFILKSIFSIFEMEEGVVVFLVI